MTEEEFIDKSQLVLYQIETTKIQDHSENAESSRGIMITILLSLL